MATSFALSPAEMNRLREMMGEAVANVSRGLTEMFSADVLVTALHTRAVALPEVAGLVGDPGMEVAAVYLGATGDIPGHILLLMRIPTALELCDILLEQAPGTTRDLGEMETSALGEVGNIVGSFFLNSIADNQGLTLHVTPPSVVCDMAGAVVDVALIDVAMFADEAVVIDANFEHRGRRLPAWFLAFPDPAHLRLMLSGGGAR